MRIIFSLIIGLFFVISFGCKNQNTSVKMEAGYQRISGETMGTTYNVSYQDSLGRNFKIKIDSLLIQINKEVSTYIPTSDISKFNQSEVAFPLLQNGIPSAYHFHKNYTKAKEFFDLTKGNFDPTVMPLVNYWGFGYKDTTLTKVDSIAVDSILNHSIGFSKIELKNNKDTTFLIKKSPEVELDFSASAKGYGVDQVYEFLASKGVKNCMIEIGGELRAGGKNDKGKKWSIGINTPKEDAQVSDFQAIVELDNMALATSGNYRNYYIVDSMKYSHTINPSTGYPERNTLLSASIFAKDCITADALATASMVMGLPACAELIENLEGVEAYFIFGDSSGNMDVIVTTGTSKLLRKKH